MASLRGNRMRGAADNRRRKTISAEKGIHIRRPLPILRTVQHFENCAAEKGWKLKHTSEPPLVGATNIVSESSITGLLGTCPVGANDCDRNHKANRTSNSNEHASRIIPQC